MVKQYIQRYVRLLAVALLLIGVVVQMIPQDKVNAAFSPRKITLVNGGTDGGSKPGGVVGHTFNFTTQSSGSASSVRSIKFQYCTTPVLNTVCTLPTGLDTTSAALGTVVPGSMGFSIPGSPTNGTVILTRAAAANIANSTAIEVPLTAITNPTTMNQTFFVRITFHTSADGTGTASADYGSVAASTADPIVLNGTMPESLVFCTGFAVLTNCTSTTSQIAVFDDLFSPTVTRWTKAEMAASTNAGAGYSISMWGPTMTSGSNTIAAMGSQAASTPGIAQFGTNLMANTAAGTFTSGIAATFNGPGTLSNATADDDVTGTGTTFLSAIKVGDVINFTSGGAESCTVATITTNTALTCSANLTNAHTNATYTVTYASGSAFGSNPTPTANSPATVPLLRGVSATGYEVTNQYKFSSSDVVAASNEGGTFSPSDGQKYTMSYIVNVPGSQAAGVYSTTLTYICTATF